MSGVSPIFAPSTDWPVSYELNLDFFFFFKMSTIWAVYQKNLTWIQEFKLGPTQTGLYSLRRLQAQNFRFTLRICTICEVKTKTDQLCNYLIHFASQPALSHFFQTPQ